MASSENGINIESRGNFVDVAGLETEFKKDKSRAKSNFTRSRNKLLLLVEDHDLPSRHEVKEAYKKMDSCMEIVMEVLSNFSDFYTKNKELQKCKMVVREMEKIEEDFHLACETAREYLNSREDDKSSISSDLFSIDLLQRTNITDDCSETNQKEEMLTVRPRSSSEVNTSRENRNITFSMPVTIENEQSLCAPIDTNMHELKINENIDARSHHWFDVAQGSQYQSVQKKRATTVNQGVSETGMNVHVAPFGPRAQAATFEPTASCDVPSIGKDLWRQLKRVEIPVFSGDKRTYQSWKAAFLACIDSAPATGEYKMLQLRQYLSGEARKTIENLGHSAIAYEAAKERLERKYGGKRRQIAIYLEELEHFRQIRLGNARDLEQFADLLDIAIINLKEAGQHHELGDGSLYTKLQRKLTESMLARYHRWIFENSLSESVLTLRTWVIQESEFQTVASETVHGVAGKTTDNQSMQPVPRYKNPRTFFGDKINNRSMQNMPCRVCGARHGVWKCQDFIQKSVSERWEVAKRFQLCYRCLAEGHPGKSCPRSRLCGKNGCRELHHRLLHQHSYQSETESRSKAMSSTEPKLVGEPKRGGNPNSDSLPADPITSGTERKERKQLTTMITQDDYRTEFIALRTVPVILKNGTRSLKVNALLDDASTKTYINADVAAELELHGKTEKVTVNVLNGQVETFETKPVNVTLESVNSKASMNVTAYTTNRVTGNMAVIDWNRYKRRWAHLERIDFPRTAKRTIVDVLIGLDCADLLCAIEEVKGRPGEPIARLTPLGWTCIGNPGSSSRPILQTSFSTTYFARDQSEIERLNANLKRFWEIEDVSSLKEPPIIRIEEQAAMKRVEQSIKFENQMYRVSIPWKDREPVLPDNYQMALRRLENTEKRLRRSPDIATAYSKCIEQYIEKGYIRKIPEHEHSQSKWYLPHFPVFKPDKDTTKTRIVFDASAKCEGVSLNDAIHQGPKLQRDLFDVLLRFRRLPVAVVCDIAEMYLRIGIAPEDKPYHRFLWRGISQNRPPDVYEFDRVVFGVNSSPFQAQFVLQQHAKSYQGDFPLGAEAVQKSTYMDDSMDSVLNDELGIELYNQLSRMLSKAGMHARKWLSNSPSVLAQIPLQDRKAEVDLDRDQLPCAKTLGVWWHAHRDVFTFKENAPENTMMYTKRNFLKKIATLFDPIGLIAPFTIRAKMLLQDMWTAGLEWDDKLTEPLTNSARAWFGELGDLKQLQIPRCLGEKQETSDTMSLHTFVDASTDAYGAVVYARCTYKDGFSSSNIIAAKTRVAPSISTSIPRLELMAAIVGVRLTTRISKVLEIPMNQSTFWSDSANVLWWIRGRSREFKPFVANRVGEIQSNTNPEQWRYVPTSLNPADFLSRGMKATDLAKSNTWWRGPDFLRQSENTWPISKAFGKPTGDVEIKRSTAVRKEIPKNQNSGVLDNRSHDCASSAYIAVDANEGTFLLDPSHYSSWLKLRRIQAWVNRFIKKLSETIGSQNIRGVTG